MSNLLVDYSFGRPDLHALKACGYTGVVRYLAFDNSQTSGKILRSGEVAAIHAAGLTIRLNWENGGDDVLRGSAAGRDAGAEADRQAKALGAPAFLPIYYSVDFDAQPSQYPFIGDYLNGAHSASGRPVGVYGSGALLEAMIGRRAATLGWQAQSTGWAGSHNPDGSPRLSPLAHLCQRTGGGTLPGAAQFGDSIDEDVLCRDDHAAWYPPGVHPTPTPIEGDDDVQILAEATSPSKDGTVKEGNVFLLPCGAYVAGHGIELEYVAAGLAKSGRHKMTGEAIRAFR